MGRQPLIAGGENMRRLYEEGALSRPTSRGVPRTKAIRAFLAGLVLLAPSAGAALQVGNLTGEMCTL